MLYDDIDDRNFYSQIASKNIQQIISINNDTDN